MLPGSKRGREIAFPTVTVQSLLGAFDDFGDERTVERTVDYDGVKVEHRSGTGDG